MFTFLHAADLHLDTPVTGVAGVDMPRPALEVLRDASLRAWDGLVDAAVAHRVDFVLLAGGIYDGPERGLRAQLRFHDGLSRLDAAGIRTFIVGGSSDSPPQGWTAIDGWPESVHVFGSTQQAEAVMFEVGGSTVTVHGLSHAARELDGDPAEAFPAKVTRGFHIGLLNTPLDHDGPASAERLGSRAMHYWALGGRAQMEVHGRDPWLVHPGTTQAREPSRAHGGAKGAVLVTVEGTKVAEPVPVHVDVVRFTEAMVDLAEVATVTELIDRIREAGDPGEHDGRSVVMRAVVRGAGPVHDDLVDDGARASVAAALHSGAGVAPFSWVDRVTWRTRPSIDLDELRQGTDFLSDLLATAEAAPTRDGSSREVTALSDWRRDLPKLPGDVARMLTSPADPADPAIADLALDLALNEFVGEQA